MTALKSWVNLEVLTHTDMNLYVGAGGNLSHLFAELATGAGQLIYSTGSKAVATLAAGSAGQFLRSGGAAAPVWANTRRCRAYQSTAQNIGDNTVTVVTLDATETDPDSWFDTSLDVITPTVAGLYLVHAKVAFAANATGTRELRLEVNAAAKAAKFIPGNAAVRNELETSWLGVVSAGQPIRMRVVQTSGGVLATVAGAAVTYLEVVQFPGAA